MARPLAVTLFDLPPELHLHIFTHLDYPTRLALSQTNVYFRSMIAVEKPTTSEQKLSFLCAAENWAGYKNKYSCSRCLKLRFRCVFADKQVKAKRAKGHAESNRRFCLECGVKRRIYSPGQMIDISGYTHYICGLCWQMCGSGLYCTFCGGCERCLEKRKTHLDFNLGIAISPGQCPRCLRPYANLGESEPERDDTKLLTALQNLPLCLKMAEFQEDFGMMASPEWYEEDIAKGNF